MPDASSQAHGDHGRRAGCRIVRFDEAGRGTLWQTRIAAPAGDETPNHGHERNNVVGNCTRRASGRLPQRALMRSAERPENAMREVVGVFASLPWRKPIVALCWLLTLFGQAAFAVEPKVTVSVGQKDEAFIVDAAIDVQVPLATAWEVLTDFDKMTSIVDNLKSSKIVSRDGNTWIVRQNGVARYGLLSFSFESEREIRLEPMIRIKSKSLSGTLKRMESESKITALEQGVQISYHAESVPDSMLARMFGGSFVRHEVEEQFLQIAREMLQRHARTEPAAKAAAAPGH